MKLPRWGLRLAAVAAAGSIAAATLAVGPAAAQRSASDSAWPTVRLVIAQKHVIVPKFGKFVFFDPGIYVAALRARLEFHVRRASYSKPLTLTEVAHVAGHGTESRRLPSWLLQGWNGLHRFLRVTVTNKSGKIVSSHVIPFCPNTFAPSRALPNSPPTSPFPQQCASDPFELGMVLGIQRGWAVDPYFEGGFGFGGALFRLRLGTYSVTVKLVRVWAGLLHVSASNAIAHVKLTVVKPSGCRFGCRAKPRRPRHGSLPRLPTAPALANPPKSVLPDLAPLPSWGISLRRFGKKDQPGRWMVQFGATVWIGGHSPLDVEGFRVHGAPIMQAYQYFWRNGHIVGRARAGTMGFDGKKGHLHWHFQQFAQYRLLNASKTTVLRSRKVGFCIAPTDPVNLLLRHAQWQPQFTGFGSACGSTTALWVQEMLPVGWGDTYFQSVAGQAFDVTSLPNGTYYIEIIANPDGVLHETTASNNISLRKVIIGGTPDHRTISVPAFHGIDAEH